MQTVLPIDLTDTEPFLRGDHHAMFRFLRNTAPVYWNERPDGGFWALTRHADVAAAYRDSATFSSAHGAVLGGSYRAKKDSAAGRMLVASDPPRHRQLRQIFHSVFSPGMVERASRQIDALVSAAVDRLVSDGGGDFATDVATELPAGALMAMAGIAHADAHHLVELTRHMIGFRDELMAPGTGSRERLRLASIQADIFAFFADLARLRARQPGDDLVSLLLRARIGGRRLPESDVLYNCLNFAVGGNETSSHTACAGLLACMEHPAQYDLLKDDPSVFESALDEMVRWASANAYVQRVATRDVIIRGTPIREGDTVTLWSVSANRDEDVFGDPDSFRVARSPNRHLSFGSGIHRCIGAPVAGVELSTMFQHLISRPVRLSLGGEVRRLRSNFILGITRLPVVVTGS